MCSYSFPDPYRLGGAHLDIKGCARNFKHLAAFIEFRVQICTVTVLEIVKTLKSIFFAKKILLTMSQLVGTLAIILRQKKMQ